MKYIIPYVVFILSGVIWLPYVVSGIDWTLTEKPVACFQLDSIEFPLIGRVTLPCQHWSTYAILHKPDCIFRDTCIIRKVDLDSWNRNKRAKP